MTWIYLRLFFCRWVFCVQHRKSGFGDVIKKRQSHERCELAFKIPTSHQYLALSQWPRIFSRAGTCIKVQNKWRENELICNYFQSRKSNVGLVTVKRQQPWCNCLVNPTTPTPSNQCLPMSKLAWTGWAYYFYFSSIPKFLYVLSLTGKWEKFSSILQNFSICTKCCRLAQLYHKLYHQKHKMYLICAEVVESRKKGIPGMDTTRMLNELLADDSWLESVRSKWISKL